MDHILILGNGEPPSRELFERCYSLADYFIAADGGGNVALSMDIYPHVVIGDLDSFQNTTGRAITTIRKSDQETNDLEKALQLAQKKGGAEITVLGATGRRLDQTLKNLSVLKQFNNRFKKLSFIDNYGQTQLLPAYFQYSYATGTTLSLFPLSGKVTGITTSGLKYPLFNETLENGVRDGSSNRVISEPVIISHKKGDLLLFAGHQSKAGRS